jgi:hypothetical protein
MFKLKYIFYLVALTTVLGLFVSCSKKDSQAATYTTNKTALKAAIDSLTTVYNNSVGGTKPGQYSVEAKAALDTAISLATQVNASNSYSQQEVNNALNSLLKAGAQFSTELLQEVSVANLVAFWKFSGNTVDSSGNGHNGILTTGYVGSSTTTAVDGATLPQLVPDRFGRPNMAYYFNNGATVEVPYSASLNPQNFTICLWLKRDGTSDGNYMVSLDRWNGYKFQLQGSNLPFLTVNTSTGDHDQDAGGSNAIDSANVWRFVAVSFTPGTEKFYIKDKLVSTATVTGVPLTVSSAINLTIGNELPKSAYNMVNQNDPNYFWGASYFRGTLDDIRFYNTALTDAEVRSIYISESSL